MRDWCIGLAVLKRDVSATTFEVVIVLLIFEITLTFRRK